VDLHAEFDSLAINHFNLHDHSAAVLAEFSDFLNGLRA